MSHARTTSEPASQHLNEELRWLYGLAKQLVGEVHADDLVQDTWLLVSSHDTAIEHRRPWLRRVLRNRAAMNWRGAVRRERREVRAAAEPAFESGEVRVELSEVMSRLRDQLVRLTDGERHLLDLRVRGLTAREVGQRLGVPESTARTRTHRTIDKLRRAMDRECGGRDGWLPALLILPHSAGATPRHSSILMTTKLALTVLAASTIAASSLLILDREPVAQANTPTVERPVASITGPQTPEPTREAVVARKRWREHLAAIKVAQAERRASAPESEACGYPLSNSETFKRLRPVIARLKEDLAACRHLLPDERASKMQFDAIVLGDPEAGSVIESIEPTDSDEAHADFAECFAESIYTIELPTPSRCARDSYSFVLNLDAGSVGVRLDRRNPVDDPEEIEADEAPHPEGSQAPDVVLEIATVLERKGQDAAGETLRERGFTRGQDGKWVSPDGEVELVVSVEDCNGSTCDESP